MKRPVLVLVALVPLVLLASLLGFTAALALTAPAGQAAGGTPLGTAFTYQGELADSNGSVNDTCDLQFSLWDDPSAGGQLGSTQTVASVTVADGRFTVQVNDANQFGNNAFLGEARWLQIAVRCPAGSGGYTTLSPRQELTGAPNAHFAARAAVAPWGGLVGVPAGFADGIDNDTTYAAGVGLTLSGGQFSITLAYRLPQGCGNGQIPEWNTTTWACADDNGSQYANVVVVAKSGGDFTTIQDALDSISDAGEDNPYLVWVAPGVYTETVIMEPYVDVAGAGEELTRITQTGFATSVDATIEAAANSALRSLTVENSGGAAYAIAIYINSADNFRTQHVTTRVWGATNSNRAITVSGNGMFTRLDDVTVEVEALSTTGSNYGISQNTLITGRNELLINDVTIVVSATTTTGGVYGLHNTAATGLTAILTATNTLISVHNNSTGLTVGVMASGAGTPITLSGGLVEVGSGSNVYGLYANAGGAVTATGLTVVSSGTGAYGLSSATASVIHLDSSKITGSPNAISIGGTAANETRIGASLVDGAVSIAGAGTVTCIASYDENYQNAGGFTACP
ncbi:MAG: hypothetical protein L0332_20085 [Chloroflexi bacterium]|nr:hypothetical protein [Chloroflexota bacterium]MCI0577455.1 hypothetical protein [Chloroflexota bacterium]MCI0647800.1 hypothetical protein [Chloroflexota bacterium]MCI0728998.1 hypothetical protein [Chloroflexota bacterium]